MKRNTFLLLLAAVALSTGCKSYEDSFNRNLDSTGLYVTNSGSNTISMFGADPKSGILNDLGTVAAGTTPVYITLNSAGTFAYVVNSGSNDVYVYSIDKKSRKLTLASTVATGTTPRMIAFHKSGSYAYVVNQGSTDISKFFVDATTGALSSLGATTAAGGTPIAIATFLDYAVIAVSNTAQLRLFDITASTGAIAADATPAAALAAIPAGISILATSSTQGMLYAPTVANQVEYFSTASWAATPTTTQIASGTTPAYIGFNSAGSQAFASNYASGNVSLYSVSTGTLTATGTATTCTNPSQVIVSSANFVYLVCRGDNKVNAYSAVSGSLSLIGSYTTGTTPTSVAGY